MSTDHTTQTVLFNSLFEKPIVAKFDQAHSSSDGGLVLLRAADEKLGLTEAISTALQDWRDPSRIQHTLRELIQQRVFGMASGYPDGNDAATLKDDAMHKLSLGRDPVDGLSLASQPTLSRLENDLGPRNLVRLSRAITDTALRLPRHQRRKARCVTLDFDPTDDHTHGQQQLAFFHGYYDSYCYLPLVATMSLDDDPKQHLLGAMLRPGDAAAHLGFEAVLRRLLPRLRTTFPKATIRVRLDGGFASPEVLDFLESECLEYVIGFAKTKPLAQEATAALMRAQAEAKRTGKSAQVFGSIMHEIDTWPHERRVVYKAEVVCLAGRTPRDNMRFVVTNLKNAASAVYRIYRKRGDMENRIKELKLGLQMDRTSCSSFLANQARVLLTTAAYMLLQAIRIEARGTKYADAQVWTIREHLLKLAVWAERSARRVVIHLPHDFPGRGTWVQVARRLGAAVA